MKGRRKPYDEELAQWSRRAERECLTWFKESGYEVTDLPDGKKGVDMQVANDAEEFYVEIERRSPETWTQGPFPYDPVRLPERRLKDDSRFIVLTLRQDLRQAIVIFQRSLTTNRLREVRNRYVLSGELFFHIPRAEVCPLDLTVPLTEPIAAVNAGRIRSLVSQLKNTNEGCLLALHLLEVQPYGLAEDEWRSILDELESRIEPHLFWKCRKCGEPASEYRVRQRRPGSPPDPNGTYLRTECRRCGLFIGYRPTR